MVVVTEIAGGGVLKATGPFDIQEMIDVKRELARKYPAGLPWLFVIVDLAESSAPHPEFAEIEQLVQQDRVLAALTRPGLPFAVIAPQDVFFGLSRVWQSIAEEIGWDIQILRDRLRTEAWIRIQVLNKFGEKLPALDPDQL